jgi:hypothetical protein
MWLGRSGDVLKIDVSIATFPPVFIAYPFMSITSLRGSMEAGRFPGISR